MARTRVPAIEGWFTLDDDPSLLAQACTVCGTRVFPRTALACPNPHCEGIEFDTVQLARTGKVWSYTTNHYPPPLPYVAADPFVPYTVAAVELDGDAMVVLGQLVAGTDAADVQIGTEVELAIETLFTDDEDRDHVVWKWRIRAEVGA